MSQIPQPLFDTMEYLTQNEVSTIPAHGKKDYTLAKEFLYSYRGSAATFSAYRREIERLLQWAWFVEKKNLKDLRRADMERYIEFCKMPPLTWIGTKNVARFKDKQGARAINPDWRPFVATISKTARDQGQTPDAKHYQLSQKALQAVFAILSSFFNYLIQEDYMDFNPVSQIRQKSKFIRKHQGQAPIRRLSELQWGYVIETTQQLADEDPDNHERSLFIMNALYGMYLRISELTASERWQPLMGHFQPDQDGHWWFTTVGKGNKERMITVSNAMLEALKRYRNFLNLSSLPSLGENTPLISKQRGRGPVSSTRQIRMIVQDCFNAAIARMQTDGFNDDAQQLKSATVHWLRHTGISDDVKTRPREHVRDDAGHGSSAITDRYIDVELRERHASGRKKPIHPDE